jgi:succinyl-diaminopimelate desuccinylase
MTFPTDYARLDSWIDAHFDEETAFLQQLIRVPTDTPPGNNAPHAERTAELIKAFGFEAEKHPVPEAEVRAYGMESITNLIVRRVMEQGRRQNHRPQCPRRRGAARRRLDHDPYGGEIVDGKIYGRASAVSKCDFASFTFAVRALEALGAPLKGARRAALHLRRGIRRRNGPGLAAQKGPDQTRPADRGRLLV